MSLKAPSYQWGFLWWVALAGSGTGWDNCGAVHQSPPQLNH
jgi:hypothetical protein